jgi:hypothetical protein
MAGSRPGRGEVQACASLNQRADLGGGTTSPVATKDKSLAETNKPAAARLPICGIGKEDPMTDPQTFDLDDLDKRRNEIIRKLKGDGYDIEEIWAILVRALAVAVVGNAETEEKLAEMMELTKQTIEEDAREWLKFSQEVQKSAMTRSSLN